MIYLKICEINQIALIYRAPYSLEKTRLINWDHRKLLRTQCVLGVRRLSPEHGPSVAKGPC